MNCEPKVDARLTARRATTYHVLLALWVVGVAAVRMSYEHATSWHFFDDAARLLVDQHAGLVGPGGLHLYRSHPEFQFGPVSIFAAEVFRIVGRGHAIVLVQAMTALAVFPVLLALETAALQWWSPVNYGRVRGLVFTGGIVLVLVWDDIATRVGHIDDAIALAASAIAIRAIVGRRPIVAALAIGIAAAAKPWAILFLPLLCALPRGRRGTALAVALFVVAATWAPFVIADPHTLAAGRFTIMNDTRSALYALGVHDARTPGWDRIAQLVAGIAVGTWLVWRGRWPGVLLAAVGTRLLLDPGAHRYYAAALVFAALVWELFGTRRRWPVVTFATTALLVLPRVAPLPAQPSGILRLVATAGAVLVAALEPYPPRDVPYDSAHPDAAVRTNASAARSAATAATTPPVR